VELGRSDGSAARRRRRGRAQAAAVLVLLALVAGACGSRLPDEVLADIDGEQTSSERDVQGGGDGGSDEVADGVDPVTGDPVPGGSGTDGGTGGTGTTGTGGGDTGGASAAACRGGATDVGVTANEIKVGAIVTASGPLPGATEGSFRGAQAYLAKVNAAGGVCGRRLSLVKGDDGLDPQRARGEFLRIEPQVLAMVGGFSVADSGFGDLVAGTEVPYFGTMVDPAGRGATVYPKTPSGRVHTGPFVYYREQYPQVQRFAFLYADVGGVRANAPTSREALKKVGFDIVHDSGLSAVSPDFTSDVIAMRDKGAQGIYLFAFEVNMHVRIARNMRQQNFEPPLKVSQIGYNSKLLELLGDIANGWTNHIDHLPVLNEDEPSRSAEVADFLAWHERVAPGSQIDLFPVSGWGAAALFVQALREVGPEVTRERLLAAVAAIQRSDGGGIRGPVNPSNGETEGCFVIVRVEQRRWVREHPDTGYECGLGEVHVFG
jgi:branched-chain amino acid transport system substrate-binding protein